MRESPYFVEATVSMGGERCVLEWARDSAFRFFPLILHPELGVSLHPFDLATTKTLALVGRLEVRDWVDLIEAVGKIQPLGYLAWAACGKDPGFSPATLLSFAARAHYSAVEVATLSFTGSPPDTGELSQSWRLMLDGARSIVHSLPAEAAGTCVMDPFGALFKGNVEELEDALRRGEVIFHPGRLRGSIPKLVA